MDDYASVEASTAGGLDVGVSSDAKELVRQPHPTADLPDTKNQSLTSPTFLMSFVKWHPAIGAFQFLADCFHPASMPPNERFERTYERFRILFWICILIDFCVMLLILIGLGLIATRVAWLTLMQ